MDPREMPLRRGVVAVIVREGRMLVIRRSQAVEAPGAYCFPGGAVEAGETEAAALEREIAEELGVRVRPLRPVWRSVTSWQVELSWWLAELPAEALLVPNPAEVVAVHWHTPAELAALAGLLDSNRQFLAALAAGQVDLGEVLGLGT